MLNPTMQRSASPRSSGPSVPMAARARPHGTPPRGTVPGHAALLGRRQRGYPAGRWIDDQRRLGQGRRPGAVGPDLLAVAARIAGRRALAIPRQGRLPPLLADRGSFLVGQHVPALEIGGPLERRECPVLPNALKIRVAPWRPRRLPRVAVGLLSLSDSDGRHAGRGCDERRREPHERACSDLHEPPPVNRLSGSHAYCSWTLPRTHSGRRA